MDTKVLYTIGYERLSPEELVDRLRGHGIKTVVDVREIPNSRKRGFSKSQLIALLGVYGIRYIHAKGLGSPKYLREKLKRSKDFDSFAATFRRKISSQPEALTEISKTVSLGRCCLLCLENDALACHRSIVAEEVVKSYQERMEIKHL